MKLKLSKTNALLSVSAFAIAAVFASFSIGNNADGKREVKCCSNPDFNHVCIMKTILGLDTSDQSKHISSFKTPELVETSLKRGLVWIDKAQAPDGGWGAGSHSSQGNLDPHAVTSDPATTSLVTMSLLRTDNTLEKGEYKDNLKKGTEFLLKAIEDCPENQSYITLLTNTQPQVKLGRNIDVILTAQFFTNLLRYDIADVQLKKRIEKALDKCVVRIQKTQSADGSWQDGGWAPVLQSALANNALESADDVGRRVDTTILNRSRNYQNGNFDLKTNATITDKAAGVMLYGLSSTARASAKESQRAQEVIVRGYGTGKVKDKKITEENLRAAGIDAVEAKQLMTAYSINQAAGNEAVREDVMAGFGNNGGEEFMSFLMTGESILMQGGDNWKKWYDMMSGKLINIQNNDGSWNGHHCITSPVFCTATCLLILSIHNDMQFSIKPHPKKNS
ncbi:MAG: hypothetical protein ABIP79_16845 [Chitinophagaceae bacterium]